MRSNPPGFHTALTDSVKEHILENVAGNYVVGQIARMAMVPRTTLRTWLLRGEKEATNNENTIFAQLWIELEQKRGIEIREMLQDVKNRRTNWQASWELLRAIAREDFGVESIEYKELLELYTKLSEALKRLTDNPLHGVANNAREMDSKGNSQEQG